MPKFNGGVHEDDQGYLRISASLVAAKKLGRHFLGFEISEAYCEIARKRLAGIDAQPSLFAQPDPEQLAL